MKLWFNLPMTQFFQWLTPFESSRYLTFVLCSFCNFSFYIFNFQLLKQQFSFEAIQLGLIPTLPGFVH